VRERTLHKFQGKEDLWLDEKTPFGPYYQANNYYRWFHVFEDELTHLGQIRLIMKYVKRNNLAGDGG